jgi:hypothetical protein
MEQVALCALYGIAAAVGRMRGKTAITIRAAAIPQRVSGVGMSQICHSLFAHLFPRALTFSLSLVSSHPQILLSEGSSRNRTFVSHAGLSLVPAMADWNPECTCPPLTYFLFWRSGSSANPLSLGFEAHQTGRRIRRSPGSSVGSYQAPALAPSRYYPGGMSSGI